MPFKVCSRAKIFYFVQIMDLIVLCYQSKAWDIYLIYMQDPTNTQKSQGEIISSSPLISFPNPIEDDTFLSLLLDFSFITSSSLDTSTSELIFFFFLFFWRGGSFLGKANIGKMTRSMAMEQRRKPLHLRKRNQTMGSNRWNILQDSVCPSS